MADACIEGHNLAEERLRAEVDQDKEAEAEKPEAVEARDEDKKGPEIIVLSKKEDTDNMDLATED
jgi:small subunit ribosomal protein S2